MLVKEKLEHEADEDDDEEDGFGTELQRVINWRNSICHSCMLLFIYKEEEERDVVWYQISTGLGWRVSPEKGLYGLQNLYLNFSVLVFI